jgi:quinol monooxygenase YgiN
MVRSVLVLRARPGRRDDVTALFDQLGILREASTLPGFLAVELDWSADDPDELLVTASWESAASYDAWLESPVRERMRAPLEALLAERPQPRVYERVDALP